jgi:hypothetical protein
MPVVNEDKIMTDADKREFLLFSHYWGRDAFETYICALTAPKVQGLLLVIDQKLTAKTKRAEDARQTELEEMRERLQDQLAQLSL